MALSRTEMLDCAAIQADENIIRAKVITDLLNFALIKIGSSKVKK